MKVLFVNVKYKYLFIKEYSNKRELLNLLIKLFHTPTAPILPLMIEGLVCDRYDFDSNNIKFWYDRLGYRILPNYELYVSYPMYVKNK